MKNDAGEPGAPSLAGLRLIHSRRQSVGPSAVYVFELYEEPASSNHWYRLVIYPEKNKAAVQQERIRNGVPLDDASAFRITDSAGSAEIRILGGRYNETGKPWYKVWRFDPAAKRFVWSQDQVKEETSTRTEPQDWSLDYFAGGSITWYSFEVKITPDGTVSYRKFHIREKTDVESFRRELTPAQREAIREVIVRERLLELPSQDYRLMPMLPDRGRYKVTVWLGGRSHSLDYAMGLRPNEPASDCTRAVTELTRVLNAQLKIDIR